MSVAALCVSASVWGAQRGVIMINLSLLTYSLVSVIFRGNKSASKKLLNLLSTVVPLILIIVGYALDGTTASVVSVEEVLCLIHSIYDLLLSYAKVTSVRERTAS
jgi:formate hydrogenlyase subunit 3/multisubunit Na+/H+ antiporter MnhD subunit